MERLSSPLKWSARIESVLLQASLQLGIRERRGPLDLKVPVESMVDLQSHERLDRAIKICGDNGSVKNARLAADAQLRFVHINIDDSTTLYHGEVA
jgi:hypothetical protein